MSTYLRWTKHPETHHWHHAVWLDDHFGHHHYGVKFNDDKIFDPSKETLETSDKKPGDDEIIDATRDLHKEMFGYSYGQTPPHPEGKSYEYGKKISAELVDDIMCAAMEGGISYWCTSALPLKNDYRGCQYAHEILTRGGTLLVKPDGEREIELTLEKFLKGLSMFDGDPEQHDAGDADAIVQYAVFGEIVYG
jgi:hypothetical protein